MRASNRPRVRRHGSDRGATARPGGRVRRGAVAWVAGALAAAAAIGPAVGQSVVSAEAFRQSYTFLGDRLEIRVEGVPSGSLRVVRGGAGALEVAGRAPEGIAGAARERDGSEVLTLTAVGAERAVFLVVVPTDAVVRVRLPGEARPSTFDPPRASDQWEWSGRPVDEADEGDEADDAGDDDVRNGTGGAP